MLILFGLILELIVILLVIGFDDVINGYVFWFIFSIIFCVFLKSIRLLLLSVLFKIIDVFVIYFLICWLYL